VFATSDAAESDFVSTVRAALVDMMETSSFPLSVMTPFVACEALTMTSVAAASIETSPVVATTDAAPFAESVSGPVDEVRLPLVGGDMERVAPSNLDKAL